MVNYVFLLFFMVNYVFLLLFHGKVCVFTLFLVNYVFFNPVE